MKIPEEIRRALRTDLWSRADELDWSHLSWHEKTAQYELWTTEPSVGGLLANYIDPQRIRVYIKDTIMKGYSRSRHANPRRPFVALELPHDVAVVDTYERPHGRRLRDGRIVVWGKAEDWKSVLTAAHERAYGVSGARPHAAVLLAAQGRYHQPEIRGMVEDAARRLGIERVLWLS